jgi:hypothetical protein
VQSAALHEGGGQEEPVGAFETKASPTTAAKASAPVVKKTSTKSKPSQKKEKAAVAVEAEPPEETCLARYIANAIAEPERLSMEAQQLRWIQVLSAIAA